MIAYDPSNIRGNNKFDNPTKKIIKKMKKDYVTTLIFTSYRPIGPFGISLFSIAYLLKVRQKKKKNM